MCVFWNLSGDRTALGAEGTRCCNACEFSWFTGVHTTVLPERVSDRISEQFGVIEAPKNSSQESVEIVKMVFQEQSSERWREQFQGYRSTRAL